MLIASLCLVAFPSFFQDPRTPETLPQDRTLAWIHVPDVRRLRKALPRLPLFRIPERPGWGTLLEGILGQQTLAERSADWDKVFLPFDKGLDFILLESKDADIGFENLILGQASKASLLKKQRHDLEALFLAGATPRQGLLYREGVAEDTPARYSWYQHREPVEMTTGVPSLAVGRSDLCILQAGRRTVLRVSSSSGDQAIRQPPLADMAGLIGLAGRKGRSSFGQELGEERKSLLLSTGLEVENLQGSFLGMLPLKRVLTTLQEEDGALVEHIRVVTRPGEFGPLPELRQSKEGVAGLVKLVSRDCVAAISLGLDFATILNSKSGSEFLNKKTLGTLIPGLDKNSTVTIDLCLMGSVRGTSTPQPLLLISGASGSLDSKATLRRVSEWIRDSIAPKRPILEPKPYGRKSGIYYLKFVDYLDEWTDGFLARILLGGGYLTIGTLGDRIAITGNPKILRRAQKKLAAGETLDKEAPQLNGADYSEAALGQGFIDYRALSERFGALTEQFGEVLLPFFALIPQVGNLQMETSGLKTNLLSALVQGFALQTFEIHSRDDGFEISSRGGGLFSPTQWALACEGLFCLARIHALSRY